MSGSSLEGNTLDGQAADGLSRCHLDGSQMPRQDCHGERRRVVDEATPIKQGWGPGPSRKPGVIPIQSRNTPAAPSSHSVLAAEEERNPGFKYTWVDYRGTGLRFGQD